MIHSRAAVLALHRRISPDWGLVMNALRVFRLTVAMEHAAHPA